MKVICDCGEVLIEDPMPAPSDEVPTSYFIKMVGQVGKPGELQLKIQCTQCKRIFIEARS